MLLKGLTSIRELIENKWGMKYREGPNTYPEWVILMAMVIGISTEELVS